MVRPTAAALCLALGAAAGACAPITPETAHARDGRTEFHYDGPAEAVMLRGTMTDWRPVALDRAGSGFRLAMALGPGRYEYRLEVLRTTGVEVWVPAEAEHVGDGFGGENAVIRVQ